MEKDEFDEMDSEEIDGITDEEIEDDELNNNIKDLPTGAKLWFKFTAGFDKFLSKSPFWKEHKKSAKFLFWFLVILFAVVVVGWYVIKGLMAMAESFKTVSKR